MALYREVIVGYHKYLTETILLSWNTWFIDGYRWGIVPQMASNGGMITPIFRLVKYCNSNQLWIKFVLKLEVFETIDIDHLCVRFLKFLRKQIKSTNIYIYICTLYIYIVCVCSTRFHWQHFYFECSKLLKNILYGIREQKWIESIFHIYIYVCVSNLKLL